VVWGMPGAVVNAGLADRDYGMRVCGSEIQDRLAFQCSYGCFWVTLLAMATEKFAGAKRLC
jgi:hypothetical protein